MILFTDIGKDIDDAVALTYAIIKGVPLNLIVTTSKDSHKAAMITKNMLHALSTMYSDVNQIRVMYGSNKPLKEGLNHGVVYNGPFAEGYLEIEKFDPMSILPPFAPPEYLMKWGTAIVISPLTDYLSLLHRNIITGTVFMGLPKETKGIVEPDMNSYNFKCDPYASEECFKFQNDIPFVFIGKDCAYKVPFTQTDFNSIGEINHPVAKFLKDHAFQTFEHFKISVPDLYERVYKGTDNMSYCYDPLTVLALTNPELFTFKEVGLHKIAMDVDAKKAKDTILSTIMGGLR